MHGIILTGNFVKRNSSKLYFTLKVIRIDLNLIREEFN